MSNSTKEHQEIIIQNTEIDFTRDQPMEITPYDYQIPVIEKLLEFIDKNAHVPKTTCYVVMPGGSGKTVIFSELIKRLNQRAIILSPTLTISDQNFKTTQIMNPGAKISMFNSFSRDLNGEILFTTYHSMLGLIKRGE